MNKVTAAPTVNVVPHNMRDVLQKQIQQTVNRAVNDVTQMSVGGFDGRFIINYPAKVKLMSNDFGEPYHLVGISTSSDLSVAAP